MTDDRSRLTDEREVALVEILDRALGAGVVITGDVTISLADVDLVYLSLRVLVGSVPTIRPEPSAHLTNDVQALAATDEDRR